MTNLIPLGFLSSLSAGAAAFLFLFLFFLQAGNCVCTAQNGGGMPGSSRFLRQLSPSPRVTIGYSIVGGTQAEPVEFMVSLRSWSGLHSCGATLIHPRAVLTAAHCLDTLKNPDVEVGRYRRSGSDPVRIESFETIETIIHEDYGKSARFHNDIAILILKGKSTRRPIGLASSAECFERNAGCEVEILGWGDTSYDGSSSETLQSARTNSISRRDCEKSHGSFRITESMICAGDLVNGGVDSCHGDSGGPLLLGGKQVGIVSWGIGCGDKYSPGVYTSIPELHKWIHSKLSKLEPQTSIPGSLPSQTAVADPCKCTDDGVVNGVDTGRIGCKQHLIHVQDYDYFCMVVGGSSCPAAKKSTQYLGTYWRFCHQISSKTG